MELHCDTCARLRTAEPPAGPDDSRAACPGCGAAVGVAPVVLLMDRRSRVFVDRRRRAA